MGWVVISPTLGAASDKDMKGEKGERGERGVRKMGLGGMSPPPYLVSVQGQGCEWPEEEKKKVEILG